MLSLSDTPEIRAKLAAYNVAFQVGIDNNIEISGINVIDWLVADGSSHQVFENPPRVKMIKTDPDAVIPSKARGSDVGFDLTIIKLAKELRPGIVRLYDTGIQARVPWGHYLEILPRSSLSKSGWMLANSVGIIDPSYTGNLLVAVTRSDPNAPDLELPFRGFQLVVRKQHHMSIEVIEQDDVVTARASGGFGSTGV